MLKYAVFLFFLILLASCGSPLPEKKSGDFSGAVRSFYVGLAAMQAADDSRARRELDAALKLAPGEPALWGNLGILQMRQKEFDESAKSLEKARSLAPENGQIYTNIAVLETQRGDFIKVKESLKKSIEADPRDPKSIFALASEYERDAADEEAIALYKNILELKPANPAVLLELIRLSAKKNEIENLKGYFSQITPREGVWDEAVKEQYASLKASVDAGASREVSQKIAFFRNVMLRLPEFRSAISSVKFSDTTIGEVFLKPLKLEVPDFSPAPPDEGLSFQSNAASEKKALLNKLLYLDGDSAPVNAIANAEKLRIGSKDLEIRSVSDIEAIDLDYNFKNDFVVLSPGGLLFLSDSFEDITSKATLPGEILKRGYSRAFLFDVEIDGDLDIILASDDSAPVVLRNNADGSFKNIPLFSDLIGIKEFASGDFDEDGDIDPAFIDGAGRLQLFSNERAGQFKARKAPMEDTASSINASDLNGDGKLDLNILLKDGRLLRAADKDDGLSWETADVLKQASAGAGPLIIQDFDNNGANDIANGASLWLSGEDGKFGVPKNLPGIIGSYGDLNGDGKLDLSGFGDNGLPANFLNLSQKNYAWQILRPRSAKAEGDQRVNSFGIGGEMELRAGLLSQKRVISSPQAHFGLGEQKISDLLRIVWGNGFIQAEFDLEKNQPILVKQRLTGSCPHLFAWNGKEFKLVKDSAPLATSLGLRVSDKGALPVNQTEEWYKIPGEMLLPNNGYYELRITDELWESYYVDHYSLLAIDHPENTEVFANELYPVPLPLKLHTTSGLKQFSSAKDDQGNDVLHLISSLDERHLDTFEEGRYQGLAKEHFVELELPEIPAGKELQIIGDGWLHPTDTSLNIAISQSRDEKPKGLSLDVLNEFGAWETVKEDFGVPAGKLKTIVIDLPAGIKHARLRTNMEIFWDRLAWAEKPPEGPNIINRLSLSDALLRFRGFSAIDKKDDSSPEMPDYNRVETTIQRWRSIEGYYTRYGSIKELLAKTDDRYAIVNSGDEMILKFPALPPPNEGFKRDFVIIGDGWIKEGDYNNLFSKTILPLPSHKTPDYSRLPKSLEADPHYQRNAKDWQDFHTRYIAPDSFRDAMRGK